MTKFEERLWSLIRNFVELGHNNAALLVAAVRIVEIQELVDQQLESSGKGMPSLLHMGGTISSCKGSLFAIATAQQGILLAAGMCQALHGAGLRIPVLASQPSSHSPSCSSD